MQRGKWHFNPDTATKTLIHQQAQPSFSWVKLSETWRSGMTIPRKNQKVVISGKETNCDKMWRRSKAWPNWGGGIPLEKAKPDTAEKLDTQEDGPDKLLNKNI